MPPSLPDRLKAAIRDVPDFPKQGILFKDITPVFLAPSLVRQLVDTLAEPFQRQGITRVVGIESRGFLLGPMIAQALDAGFVLVRKAGKLPPETEAVSYDLEYGSATIEMPVNALRPGDRVLIHDDLLATGGTAAAAAELAQVRGAEIAGFNFLVELTFLNGRARLQPLAPQVVSVVGY